jgi:SAM-dependent methyltransferase
MDELTNRRSRSFGTSAAAYAEHRPDYPEAGIRWGLAAATRPVHDVLDLAAGTGKLTGNLLGLGFTVTAVEPDPAMRAELTRWFPAVPARSGTAERIPLQDASADAVFVGQAFHWFDADAALTEIARVLRPGGALVVLWNGEDPSVDWVAELVELSQTAVPHGWRGELELPAHPAFDPAERTVVPHALRRTVDSAVDYFATHSRMLVAEPADGAAALERVRAYLRSRRLAEFDLPLVTTVVRARRR